MNYHFVARPVSGSCERIYLQTMVKIWLFRAYIGAHTNLISGRVIHYCHLANVYNLWITFLAQTAHHHLHLLMYFPDTAWVLLASFR